MHNKYDRITILTNVQSFEENMIFYLRFKIVVSDYIRYYYFKLNFIYNTI